MNLLEKYNSLPEDKRAKFVQTIKEKGTEFGIYPLANNQNGMWCVYRTDFEKENPFYNAAFKIEFKEKVEHEKIKAAIFQLWDAQDIFSFKYIEIDGVPYQYYDKDSRPIIEEIDVSGIAEDEVEGVLQKREKEFCLSNFNLFEENPIKFRLIRVNNDYEVLFISVHHIISDGWSDGIICKMIIDGYSGQKPEKSSYQYSKYIIHESTPRMQEKMKNNITYWKEMLTNSEHFLDLPTVYDRFAAKEKRSAMTVFTLDAETTNKIKSIVKETQSNLHAVLLGLFTAVLSRYSNKSSMNIGTTLANRDDLRYVNLVGDFASVVIMPITCDEKVSVIDTMETVKNIMFDSMDHSNVILSNIIENVPFQRMDCVHPLYQIIFAVHSKKLFSGCTEGEEMLINGSKVIVHTLNRDNASDFKLDMCVVTLDTGSGLDFQIEYSTKLFSQERIASIANAFIYFIRDAVKDTNQKICECRLADTEELRKQLKNLKIKYVPKKLLEKTEIYEENIAAINSEMALLDISKHSVPVGFEGDIYFKKENIWYSTGEKGCIDENGEFSIIEYKSRVISFNNTLIDLKQSENILKDKFNLDFCKLIYDRNKNLILYYDGSVRLYGNDLLEHLHTTPTFIYKTRDIYSSKTANNIKHIISSVKELYSKSEVEDVVVVQQTNGELFDIIFSTKKGERLSRDIVESIDKNNKNENVIFKFCEKFPKNKDGIIISEIDYINLYLYPKAKKSDTEERVAAVWQKVLGNDDVFGLNDKFFEVGGSSLKIIQMMNMLNQEFSMNVNIAELFDCNTISEIAEHLDRKNLSATKEKSEVESLKF